MSAEWIRKSGRTLERRNNSVNGNPRYWVTFADGTRLPTATDASVNYVIPNSEFDGEVRVHVARGEIIGIEAAMECGYCGGTAVRGPDGIGYVHADDGDRVRPGGPGDFVSARHNVAGTPILAVDLVDADE